MIPRYALAALLGGVVTFGLFFLMQELIRNADANAGEKRKGKVIEFVRLKREEVVQEKKREIPDKKPPEQPPPPPPINLSQNDKPNTDATGFAQSFDFTPDLGGGPSLTTSTGDSDSIPLVRVDPAYPIRARERGIEGWVEIEFTITPRGTIADPKVVGYKPPSIFNNSALRAIRRWKYNPKIVDGKPVSRNEIVRLVFQL